MSVLCAACCAKTIGSIVGRLEPGGEASHKGCWWLAAWLGWTGAERGEAREQLWLSRSNRAEPGSCWLFSEYAVCVCVLALVFVCVCVQGALRGSDALIRNRIFTLQITTKQFSRPQTQTSDVFIEGMDGWEWWRDGQKNAGTRAQKQEGMDLWMDGWVTRIKLLLLREPY